MTAGRVNVLDGIYSRLSDTLDLITRVIPLGA